MIGSKQTRWMGWVGAALLTGCVVEDKGVGVEDTDEATQGESSETSGMSTSATTSATTETGEVTGEVTSSDTRAETDTGTTETTSATTETSTTETSTGETGTVEVPCDLDVCTEGDVCVDTLFPPACEPLREGEMCPPEQEMSQCGGIGFACCCDPPPPPESRCVTPEACGDDVVSCECLGDVCPEGFECSASGADPEHLFVCQTLPKP